MRKKQIVDRDRTTADAIVTASIAGVLHKLSPVLSKYDVRRNKFFYNKGDDFKGTTIDLDDLADATRINEIIEDFIRIKPCQYLWAHRRFKNRPLGEPDLYNVVQER